ADQIILNDVNRKIIELFEFIKNTDTRDLLLKISKIIEKYQLSNTTRYGYKFYHCDSDAGLSAYNKDNFLKLRQDYNQSKDILLLYILIVFAFNNQIRFNKKGEFNLPVGKRDFNEKMREKLILFSEMLKSKNINFANQDFRNFDLTILPKDTLIYCDPPYLITLAGYNENGGWHEQDENDLLIFLDKINKLGLKFALSNVLVAKNRTNDILQNWINNNHYHCHYLEKSYTNSNYQRKYKESKSIEVLITNY
ncbi:DNA adenine methylase, partial [Moraxella boevrei]